VPCVGRMRAVQSGMRSCLTYFICTSLLLLAFSAISCVAKSDKETRLSINELMAKNGDTILDERDKAADWVELQVEYVPKGCTDENMGTPECKPQYPSKGDKVNLSGWAITDDPEHKVLWHFPDEDVIVGDSGLLLVFMSGASETKDDKSKPPFNPLAPLHANLKLSNKGEYLGILRPGKGKEVSDEVSPSYPVQYEDISWGRSSSNKMGYMLAPTPGKPNTGLISQAIPIVKVKTKSTDEPLTIKEDLVVKACIATVGVSSEEGSAKQEEVEVYLQYRVNFNRDHKVRMNRALNSTECKEDEGFFEYVGTVEKMAFSGPGGARGGDMLRWFVSADLDGQQVREPSGKSGALIDADAPQYYGTVVVDTPEDKNGLVDKLHLFIPDREAMDIERKPEVEARCSLYFQGRFYDNVKIRQRGITALLWPKKKFKLDFKGPDFRFSSPATGGKTIKAEEVNLQSHWEEPGEETYMRENVAVDFFREGGLPVFAALHVEVHQNGRFYGLYSIVEQIDEEFLKRIGYNPNGHLYKAFSGTASNLNDRVPQHLMNKVYRRGNKAGAGADEDSAWADLKSLTDSLAGNNPNYQSVEEYLYAHVNLPEVVNELALQAAILNQDRCTKNYYVYYDMDQELWSRFPWDLEAVMAISNGLFGEPAKDYCMLVCPQFNSPLYCDSDHPQVS